MGSFSIWHWLIVLAVVLVLFGGGGKISRIMGDMAKGVKAFKKGLKEEEDGEGAPASAPKTIPSSSASTAPAGSASTAEPVVRRDDSARS
jgi:sec-independent protein translocase protein TatA